MADKPPKLSSDDPAKSRGWCRPRFSIVGLLYLTACLALGLTVAVAKPSNIAAAGIAGIDWVSGLLAIATSGIVMALLQQAWQVHGDRRFRLAALLRYAAAAGLCLCVVMQLMLRFGVIVPPERDGFFLTFVTVADTAWLLLLATGASLLTQPRVDSMPIKTWRNPVGYGLTAVGFCVFAAHVFSGLSIIHYLTHIATVGIEAAITLEHQRAGAFPDHRLEEFFTYKASLASLAALVSTVASAILIARAKRPVVKLAARIAFAAGTAALVAYNLWWRIHEMPRVSPDLASVSSAAAPVDWLYGLAALSIVSAWIASGLTSEADSKENATLGPLGRLPLALGAVGLISAGTWTIVGITYSMFDGWWSLSGAAPMSPEYIAEVLRYLILSPEFLLVVAATLAGIRLAWLTFRGDKPSVRALPLGRFMESFASLMLVGCVAIPTLAAYSFCSWLGPWWR